MIPGNRWHWPAVLLAASLAGTNAAERPVPITALAFTPDGRQLLANAPGGLRGLATATGKTSLTVPLKLSKIADVKFSPDGRTLAVAGGVPGENGEVVLLSWPARTERARRGGFDDTVAALAWSPDGQRLAMASADDSAAVFALNDPGEPRKVFGLAGHSGPVLAVAFSPDGNQIVTASFDRTLRVWSAADGALARTFTHHTAAIHTLAFRPMRGDRAGRPAYCASGGDDRTVRVWQPAIGRMVRIIRGAAAGIFDVAWSPDGQRLYAAGADGMARVFDGESDQLLTEWRAGESWLYRIAISPDGATVATGDWSGEVRLWRVGAPAERVW